uniref:Uncharacterized protein n=1 Tax=Lotus japonicus TaxID=34305 RepID=I3STC3_LOTJA|nr:unknown [Lotus japonicus]
MSPHIPSPSNASVSYIGSSSHQQRTLRYSESTASFIGSSSHQQHPLRYSESAASFSPFASANPLPEC